MIRYYFLILALLMAACDVPGRLVFKNVSHATVTIRFEKKFDGDSAKYTIVLPPKSKALGGPFGFGYRWTETQTREYAAQFSRIEIDQKGRTEVLTSKEEIFEFFNSATTGIFKKELRKKFK